MSHSIKLPIKHGKKKIFLLVSLMGFASSSFAEGWLETLMGFFSEDKTVTEPAPVDTTQAISNAAVKYGGGLVPALTEQLGVSSDQAAGGAGILFELAKNNLSKSDFGTLAEQVPDMDSLLSAAPKVSSTQGGFADMLGEKNSGYLKALTGAVDVYKQFNELGIQPDQIGSYVGVVSNYLNSEGGQATSDLFKKGLASFTTDSGQ